VRNALARFNQVRFESDSAREKARKRLLNAARKFGIVPVGFITTQLEVERERGVRRGAARAARAATDDGPPLPTGFVTLLMTDIESSTVLLRKLGERYRQLLNDVRVILRETVARSAGREIDVRADEFFAVFPDAPAAVRAAAEFQREIGRREWPDGLSVRVRAGIHSGEPALTDVGYIGIAVHTAARLCSAAHGGQVILSGAALAALGDDVPDGIGFTCLGEHRLAGLAEPETLYQLDADDLRRDFPPPRVGSKTA
jgi:class 3 adenylate cyclase